MQRRIAIAGTGTRALNFADAILHRRADHAELVALYDLNRKRMDGFCRLLGRSVPCYTDFSAMAREAKPDALVVCVTDCAHPELVEKAFAAGMDAIVEKPMAMDREGIARIRRAEEQYGRRVVVTFNMRFAPYSAKIKEALLERPIGRIHTVSAEWFIDRTHGNEYFHRWHGRMENGGGLLVHKATHNFDLLNWLLDDEPAEVFAWGRLAQYGAAGPFRGGRCRDCPHRDRCGAALTDTLIDGDLNPGREGDIFHNLYFAAEDEDGYYRDRCCFDPAIDIYDTMNALIKYKGGAQVNYALNAYSPWQGYRITFTGDAGRVEVGTVNPGARPAGYDEADRIRIVTGTTRKNVAMRTIDLEVDTTPHGGGDHAMFDHLFGPPRPDPLGQTAGYGAGAASAMVGIAANESIASGRPVVLAWPRG